MIRVGNLNKSYGRQSVLRNVSLSVPGGQMSVLVGHNGCGKTTLMKCLLGLAHPDSGDVTFAENEPVSVEVRRQVGYMPQAPRYPGNVTGREWISFVERIRGGVAPDRDRLIARFALADSLDKPLGTLSGGTTQKVSAAISLMYSPSYLLMDEPTAGLDPVSRLVLKDEIREHRDRGCTVLLTSHVVSEVDDLCNHLIWMHDGEVRYSGTVDSVRDVTGESRLERALARLMSEENEGQGARFTRERHV